LITTKLIKLSPLVAIFVAVAVCGGFVAASVLLTSSAAPASAQTNIASDNAITVSLGAPAYATSGVGYAQDTTPVTYAMTVTAPQSLSTVTATIVITDVHGNNMAWANQVVSINGQATTSASDSGNTATYIVPVSDLAATTYVLSLGIVYNVAGNYAVTASVSGTAA
jgi:hypothetical protein